VVQDTHGCAWTVLLAARANAGPRCRCCEARGPGGACEGSRFLWIPYYDAQGGKTGMRSDSTRPG
jgi:hypothetical protein